MLYHIYYIAAPFSYILKQNKKIFPDTTRHSDYRVYTLWRHASLCMTLKKNSKS